MTAADATVAAGPGMGVPFLDELRCPEALSRLLGFAVRPVRIRVKPGRSAIVGWQREEVGRLGGWGWTTVLSDSVKLRNLRRRAKKRGQVLHVHADSAGPGSSEFVLLSGGVRADAKFGRSLARAGREIDLDACTVVGYNPGRRILLEHRGDFVRVGAHSYDRLLAATADWRRWGVPTLPVTRLGGRSTVVRSPWWGAGDLAEHPDPQIAEAVGRAVAGLHQRTPQSADGSAAARSDEARASTASEVAAAALSEDRLVVEDAIAMLDDTAGMFARLLPGADAERFARLVRGVEAALTQSRSVAIADLSAVRAIHGDLSPDQILVGDAEFRIIDLDRAGAGPIGMDFGRWLAACRLREDAAGPALAAGFLRGYANPGAAANPTVANFAAANGGAAASPGDVAMACVANSVAANAEDAAVPVAAVEVWTAWALLLTAIEPWRTCRADWRELTERHLDLAEHALHIAAATPRSTAESWAPATPRSTANPRSTATPRGTSASRATANPPATEHPAGDLFSRGNSRHHQAADTPEPGHASATAPSLIPSALQVDGESLRVRRAWPAKNGRIAVELDQHDDIRAGFLEKCDDGEAESDPGRTSDSEPLRPPRHAHPWSVSLLPSGVDPHLPGLARLLDDPAVRGNRLVSHRPGRRAVVALADGTFAKCVRPGKAAAIITGLDRAAAFTTGFTLPAMLAADDATVVLSRVPGVELHAPAALGENWERAWTECLDAWACADDSATPTPTAEAPLGPAAEVFPAPTAETPRTDSNARTRPDSAAVSRPDSAVALLADSATVEASIHTAADEARVLEDWRHRAEGLLGPLKPDLDRLIAEVTAVLRAPSTNTTPVQAPNWGPIHRDLHDKQLMWDVSAGPGLLDVDTACRGEREIDLGNLSAHATWRCVQGVWTSAEAEVVSRAIAGTTSASGFDRARVRLYERASLLRLVCVYAFRPQWSARTAALLEAAALHDAAPSDSGR